MGSGHPSKLNEAHRKSSIGKQAEMAFNYRWVNKELSRGPFGSCYFSLFLGRSKHMLHVC